MGKERGKLSPHRVAGLLRLPHRLGVGYDHLAEIGCLSGRSDERFSVGRLGGLVPVVPAFADVGEGQDVGGLVEAAVPAVQVSDSLVVGDDDSGEGTVERLAGGQRQGSIGKRREPALCDVAWRTQGTPGPAPGRDCRLRPKLRLEGVAYGEQKAIWDP